MYLSTLLPPRKKLSLRLFLSLALLALLVSAVAALPLRAASSTLVVSEVVYDPVGTEPDGEWIELYNLSGGAIDLSGYKVGDEETAGGTEGMYQFPSGSTIAAGQVVVIANKATAFFTAYGFNPDYELVGSDANVPDMVKYSGWAGGSVGLANGGDDLLILGPGDEIVDALSWGSSTFAFNPSAPDVAEGHSLERSPATTDSDSASDWVDQATPAPGTVSGGTTEPTPTPSSSCGKSESYLATWEIQGSGHTSPYNGQQVSDVRGIVTADFQAGTGGPYEPRGFFIQAHETDCDAATSDGLFVYTGSVAKTLQVGDLVSVGPTNVVEYQGPSSFTWERTVTQLDCRSGCSVTVRSSGNGLPAVEEYDPPSNETDALAYKEAREGMLVQVSVDSTVIAPANQYDELTMIRGTGHDRPHRDAPPHGHLIVIDGDGVAAAKCGQDGLGYIKTFDTVTYSPASGNMAYGPLTYNFNTYKIQQDDDRYCVGVVAGDDSSYDPVDNPAPAADSNVLTVASFNLWNFFDTNDDPEKNDELPTQAEYDLKSRKRAEAICQSAGLNMPLVIALQEVENDVVLQKLVSDINALCGVSYDYHTLPGPDDRSIQVGFLTRSDRVTVLAANDRQGCSATNWGVTYERSDHPADVTCEGSTPYYLFNRPPLHLEAQVTLAGAPRTLHIIGNHFKSKLSKAACAQPDCTDQRIEQAQHIDSLIDSLLASDPNAAIIVTGDLNDFYNSDPLDILDKTYGVLTNTWDDKAGPPSTGQGSIQRYSYIYNGVSQTLDHFLVSDALNALPRIFSPRHVNADWPGSHVDDTTMYRSSDHDLLLLALDFTGAEAPPPSDTMHVGDLDGSAGSSGGNWNATVTITVLDGNNNPVSSATVNANWSGGYTGAASCTTGTDGRCSVTSGDIVKKQGSVTLTVDTVTHATLSYNSAANGDPDGDSNGTSITVNKP